MQFASGIQVNDKSTADGPSTSAAAAGDAEDLTDDDDELDMDELNELEASLSKTSIQIPERSGSHQF